ncbi:IS66 family insertion sequence element accessory protein TnpB, partial [Streptococcus pluranimalium]|uniref:IS66 family insertion sequence element accessory protein TnpB n=1 Tax=Streptococcus pluranimalium TaxID=82348 RepID=UPI0039FCFDE6
MAIQLSDLGQVYIVCGKTDMRQGIDSLAYLVTSHFNLDPFSGQEFWLLYKRFENGILTWPSHEQEVKALSSEQVDWLMKGSSISPNIKPTK